MAAGTKGARKRIPENMARDNIVLVGYRATGKTTVAALLGKRLNIPAIDTDPLVERAAGKTISRIFAEDGEPAFRELEARVVAETLARPERMVVATGGGVPLRADSRALLKENGTVFWLTASAGTIFKRMYGDATTADRRPALTERSPMDEIALMLQRRHDAYQDAAHFVVATDDRTVEDIVGEIVEDLGRDRPS